MLVPLFLTLSVTASVQQQRFATGVMPPPRFERADRAARLATAFPAIEKLFLKWAAERPVPGAVLGVIIDGELAWLKTTGVTNTTTDDPVNRDTLFRIASMSKSFTAMAIVKLRDEGKLRLDDPVANYLPQLAALQYPTRDSRPITIRDLLTHSEGFPEDNPWGDRQLAQPDAVMDEWMRAAIPFSSAPGVAYEYSNYGFAMLGRIIAEASGVPYDVYVRDNILLPLGMTRSTFHLPEANFATGYRWEDDQWKPEPILEHGSFGAMGGLWTTGPELARYVAFLLSAFPPRDDAESGPVRRSTAREMQQAWRSSGASALRRPLDEALQLRDGAYGYGLGVSGDCRFAHAVSHGGGLPGYGSYMQWLPEYGVGLIGMTNRTYTSPASVMSDAWNLLRATGALEPRVPEASPALVAAREEVSKLIGKWDDTLAEQIAADNLFLDRPAERRGKELRDYAQRHGACVADSPMDVGNALRGRWRMRCDRGWMDVAITLAPTPEPRVQHLAVTSVMPPDAAMSKTITRVLELGARWNDAAAARLVGKSFERAALRKKLGALEAWGTCRSGDVISGDGVRETTVKLTCDRGAVHARLRRDEKSGALESLELTPAPGERCAQ